MTSGWIGVDLDGTLAQYDGWKGCSHIGEPIPAMLARVKEWLANGVDVRIFTARIHHVELRTIQELAAGEFWEIRKEGSPNWGELSDMRAEVLAPINAWCEKHLGQKLPVTSMKDFAMVELWDDRAVQVQINTGRRIDGKE